MPSTLVYSSPSANPRTVFPLEETFRVLGCKEIDTQKVSAYQQKVKARRIVEFRKEKMRFVYGLLAVGIVIMASTGWYAAQHTMPTKDAIVVGSAFIFGFMLIGASTIEKTRVYKKTLQIDWVRKIVDIGDIHKSGMPTELVALAWNIQSRHSNAVFSIESFYGDPFVKASLGLECRYFGYWNAPGFGE